MYIAVSGNLASGKSTVAKGLAEFFNCLVYPRSPYDVSYLEDLFREPKRWTTEAQIAFIFHKYNSIRDGLAQGRIFILDRTFNEDVNVFAERFHDDGSIDTRGIELIRRLADDLERRLQPPRLVVYCACSVESCQTRLLERKRSYQTLYPPGHLERLEARLQEWRRDSSVPLLTVWTEETDYRKDEHIAGLGREIDLLLRRRREGAQLEMFGEATADDVPELANPSFVRPRQIYLAAPFTNRALAVDISTKQPSALFQGAEYIESIPKGYRRQLLQIVRAIERHGHRVLLPHRDINRWGARALPASEIATRCLAAVDDSDGIICLVAESFGSHAEIGYALGCDKPALFLASNSIATSFFGKGMLAMPGVAKISARSINALALELRKQDPWPLMLHEREMQ